MRGAGAAVVAAARTLASGVCWEDASTVTGVHRGLLAAVADLGAPLDPPEPREPDR